MIDGYYQSTPRVDSDIGPLTLFPCSSTLPSGPTGLHLPGYLPTSSDLPPEIVNETRENLKSHVSDFFHQISLAVSPEDVMEADRLPGYHPHSRKSFVPVTDILRRRSNCLSKVAKVKKIQNRMSTPYHTRIPSVRKSTEEIRQTPLAGQLLSLKLDHVRNKSNDDENLVAPVSKR